jgi:hypothetical protein
VGEECVRKYYCETCEQHFRELDHHDAWLGGCVWAQNRRRYLLILALQTFEASLALGTVLTRGSFGDKTGVLFLVQILSLTLLALVALVLLLELLLQLYLIRWGITRYEFMNWESISFLEGAEQAPWATNLIGHCLWFCRAA